MFLSSNKVFYDRNIFSSLQEFEIKNISSDPPFGFEIH
jgi:hypothetical protein